MTTKTWNIIKKSTSIVTNYEFGDQVGNMLVFLTKYLQVSHIWHAKTFYKEMHVNWHAQFKIWHILWLVKKENHMSIDMVVIEKSCATRQPKMKMIFKKIYVRFSLTCIFDFFKTSRGTLDVKLNVKWRRPSGQWCVGIKHVDALLWETCLSGFLSLIGYRYELAWLY